MTRDVNFRMSGPYIMAIPNEHVQNYRQEMEIPNFKQPAGKVSYGLCNLDLAIKKLRTNEKIINFSVAVS